jgi:hypothetical protein
MVSNILARSATTYVAAISSPDTLRVVVLLGVLCVVFRGRVHDACSENSVVQPILVPWNKVGLTHLDGSLRLGGSGPVSRLHFSSFFLAG